VPALDQPLGTLDAAALRTVVTTFRDAVKAHQQVINRLNVYPVPDGDTGTNMGRTLDAVVDELAGAADDMAAVCHAISQGSLMGARGNSGVILSQILRGVAGVVRTSPIVTASVLAEALTAGSVAAYDAVLTPVEGTILTVAREAAQAATDAAAARAALADVLRAARDEGRASLARTPELLPALRDAGVVDAGAAGFLLLLDAALAVVADVPVPDAPAVHSIVDTPAASNVTPDCAADADSDEMRYEVMFLLDLQDDRISDLKRHWGSIGDSVVVVGGEGTWNCHVHTNDIGGAIEAALDLEGRPSRIRVTDLSEEVAEESGRRAHAQREADVAGRPEDAAPREASDADAEPVVAAVVAVASGRGLASLFADLGVQRVVSGGQTLNPSTAELLAAVESAPSDQVVVLPNNKNIIAVAEQLDALTVKSVVVVPTRSMPEGLAALVVYDPEAPAASNAEQMAAAAEAVSTGEVTTAVRDTASDAGRVSAGDWIGLVRGDGIVSVGNSVVDVSMNLLDRLITSDRELVTVVVGDDATEADTDEILAWLADARPTVEVEVLEGGQPLYPYLFGVE
jgi:hypothetical protein